MHERTSPASLSAAKRLVVSLLLFSLVGCVVPLRGADVFTPEHVAKLRAVRTAEISPDGQHIAYLLWVPRVPFDDDNGPAHSELHVVDASGNSRPFITGDVNIGSIKWTPDGKGISFLAKRGEDEHRSLYVIPVDGGEARKVLSHETSISSYDWSPDGKRIAFLTKDKEPKEKKKLKKKGFDQEIYEEELRPVRVWIGTPDDDDAESRVLDLEGSASEIHWNPDGTKLAVALAPTPLIDDHYMKRKVHVVDAREGTILTRLDNPGKLGAVRWSPDGKYLAMISAEDLNDPSAGRLMVAPASGGPLRDLIPDYQGQIGAIAWENSRTLKYLGDEGVWTTLGEINVDGTGRKVLIPAGRTVLFGLTLSRDGTSAAMLSNSPTHPTEVFFMRHGAAAPRRLTDSNPWLTDVRLARQEVVTYKARDGLSIEGLLIRPLDEKPGQRYPLILSVHGGPEAHHHNGWLTRYSSPGQVAAARGLAVFYINYRGSTGRGVAFSKLGQADYAGREFDDLLDGVDHLVAMGLVDRNRVGVTGGSYGGYATAWCSTYHTERFAAGVMFVGISDLVSKGGTTDIPNEMELVHARKVVWDDWDFFLQRSPIYHVKKARTPLLILTGKDDTRVHPSQSLELYRYLKMLDQTPVRLVRYPGEGHGNRKAGARYDYNLRMMRWMEHYLSGATPDRTAPPPPHELEYALQSDEDDEDSEDEDSDSD